MAEMAPGVEQSKRKVRNILVSLLLIPKSSSSQPQSVSLSWSHVLISAFILKNDAAFHAQISSGLPSQFVHAV